MEKDGKSGSILLVDEEVFSTEGYKLLLQKDGFKVVVVNNGLSALNVIRADNFDGVIANLLTSGSQMQKFVDELKAKNMMDKVIVITDSSRIMNSNYHEMVKHFGINDVLQKPFSLELLLQKVHKKFIS